MLSQTVQTLINQLGPVVIAGVVAFLAKGVVPVGDAAIDFLNKKKEAVANQIGIEKYNSNLAKAKDIWGLVDEEFRITPALTKTIESAQEMFEEKILKLIPGLTKDEIEHLRQAVAGEVNKGKAVIIASVNTVSIPQDQLTTLQAKAQAYDQIQSTVTTTVQVVTPTA